MKFACVDLTNDEPLAKEMNISTSGFSRQLPTLMMFEDGIEVVRFPPIGKDGKAGTVKKWDKVRIS